MISRISWRRRIGWAVAGMVVSGALFLAPAAARAQAGETVTGAVQSSPGGRRSVPLPGADTVLDRRVRAVSQRLRCPVCQGESIQESPAELAGQMKEVVREQLAAGKSEQDVLNYFLAKYGDWILLEPRAEGINLLVYWIPVIFMLIGGVVLFMTVKKWIKPKGSTPGDELVLTPEHETAEAELHHI